MNSTENRCDNRMLLSVQMLVDHLNDLSWEYAASLNNDYPALYRCRFYTGEETLSEDCLYIVSEEFSEQFPADRFTYVTSGDLNGRAPHIRSIHRNEQEIANCILSVFQHYQDFESELNNILRSGGSLTDLCRVGEKYFDNPMFIHDNLFTLIALPKDIKSTKMFQYNSESGIYHIPLQIIDEFKYDENYLKTFQSHHASVWDSNLSHNGFRSIYVNLWDGAHYYGRLMINERSSALKPGQFAVADFLAQYAVMIIQRDSISLNRSYLSFEDTFVNLATGNNVSGSDLNTILDVLDWNDRDRYICVRLQSKDSSLSVNPVSAVRDVLATELSCYSSFFYKQQLCVIVNMTLSGLKPIEIQQRLASQIRDNYMCGGISNPFIGLALLPEAFHQAEAALGYAMNPKSETWFVSFERCALDYIERLAAEKFPIELLAAPQLLKLRSYDLEKGTEYYATLRAWLVNERNIPKTSDALIVHRTTLTYRLKKLKELIPMDLDDEETRLYLLLSYHMLDNKLADL